MKKSRLLGAVCSCALAFICTSPNASLVVLDFDVGSGIVSPTSYSEDGFTLDLTAGHFDHWLSGGTGDTAYIGLDTVDLNDSQLRLTGGVFDLVSLEMFYFSAIIGESLRVTSSAGGNVSLDTNVVHSFSGSAWTNLTWVNFSSNANIGGPGFDTLTLNTVVPVPAAVWLFGSGLIGLIGVSRRKKV